MPQSRSSCPPSFPVAMCCDRQPDMLFCLITIGVHSDFSVTGKPGGREIAEKNWGESI